MPNPAQGSPEHLEELLKNRYEQEFQRKETLDSKANNMMTIASTVATLYSGFGVALVTQLFKIALQLSTPVILLLIGIVILLGSIFLSTRAYMLREYEYAFNFKSFVTQADQISTPRKIWKLHIGNKIKGTNIVFDDPKIVGYMTKNADDFHKLMTKIYTRCIWLNTQVNEIRGTYVIWSQRIFLFGLCSFPIFIYFVIKS